MPRTKALRTIILENAISQNPLPPRELAKTHGLSLQSVYRTTSRLRVQGHLPPSKHQGDKPYKTVESGMKPPAARAKPLRIRQSGAERIWTPEDVEQTAFNEVMPELERLQKLSLMARHGTDAISVAAIKALEDLSRAKGTSVGPGKPLTTDEQIARLARLCLAVGQEVSERALRVAFSEKDDSEALQTHPRGTQEAHEVELSPQDSEEHPRPTPSSGDLGGREPQN